MKKLFFSLIIIILIAAGAYWWLFMRGTAEEFVPTPTETGAFDPFNRGTVSPQPVGTTSRPTQPPTGSGITTRPVVVTGAALPKLRHLSSAPIGGFMASTTASSTNVRYIDRGVGHVYQATSIDNVISKITNTTIPKVYESYWDKNLRSAVIRYMKDDDSIVNFYAELRTLRVATSTGSQALPYEIKGKFLTPSIKEMAVSPKGDRIFTFHVEDGRGIGYVSGFDESKKTKVLDIPMTQVTVDWPEENTVTINTNPSAASSGFFYTLDLKTGSFRRVVGSIIGLSAKMSPDGRKVFFSSTNTRTFLTSLYNTRDNSTQETMLKTAADKCVWSKKDTDEIYCAVPAELPGAIYPDDWYRGNVTFIDQIWHLDTTTGEVNLIADLNALSHDLIDATNLTLDPKESFLYFINKRDLTLWSLDLTR